MRLNSSVSSHLRCSAFMMLYDGCRDEGFDSCIYQKGRLPYLQSH